MRTWERLKTALTAMLAAALTAWAAPAAAQVAVPEIAPAGVRIFSSRQPIALMNSLVPENPAALQWGTPSRISAGSIRGDKEDRFDGTSTGYNGTFAGLRWVREDVGLAVETAELEVDFPSQGSFAPRLEKSQRTAALSFTAPQWQAFGIGAVSSRQRTVSPPSGQIEEIETDGWVAGVSWRLGESFFVGAGYGGDELTRIVPQPEAQAERNHFMYGLGLRSGGALVWHLEVDYFKREDAESGGVPIQPGRGYELTLVNAEAIWGVFLFGYAGYEASPLDPGPLNRRVEGYTADFGLAPLGGLAITGRLERSEVLNDVGTIATEEIVSGAVSWQF